MAIRLLSATWLALLFAGCTHQTRLAWEIDTYNKAADFKASHWRFRQEQKLAWDSRSANDCACCPYPGCHCPTRHTQIPNPPWPRMFHPQDQYLTAPSYCCSPVSGYQTAPQESTLPEAEPPAPLPKASPGLPEAPEPQTTLEKELE